VGAFTKLNPRLMVKNPVMFVVEVGSVLTSALFIQDLMQHKPGISFNLQITLWLWFTVLFANFAEAMAEGRGKAQADTLRKAKGETMAYRFREDGTTEAVSSSQLRTGDVIASRPASSSPAMARSSRAWHRSTSRRSPANPLPSFARPEATARRSPAARVCSPIGSRSRSPPTPAKLSSTA
jgi:hypothetical protein